jgi:nitroimidazol reductase NimA-like FMN-containing flavoprotein (pyridoxamine 5'-phosphate oxidase superfamily)
VWVGVRDDHLVFFTQPGSRKARNLEHDPRVAGSVVEVERDRLLELPFADTPPSG